jgi:hypothetical protein
MRRINEENFFEMSNLRNKTTGLDMLLYVSERGYAKHGPRIKVQRSLGSKITHDFFSVSIDDDPRIVAGDQGEISNKHLEKVFQFVIKNKEVLLGYWNSEIYTDELFDKIKSI